MNQPSLKSSEYLAFCRYCGKSVKSEKEWSEVHSEHSNYVFTPDQLLNALFWVYDGFDRALINCFFVYSTAESILQNKDLEGDGVHIGVRKMEWGEVESRAGSRPIFEAFAGEPISKDNKLWKYDYLGVPVFIHVFELFKGFQLFDPFVILGGAF